MENSTAGAHTLQGQSRLEESDQSHQHVTQPSSQQTRTLNVTTSGAGNLALTPPSSTSPTFYLRNTTFSLYKNKPSLTLHSHSSTGRILAVLKLGKIKPHTVGVGDPNLKDVAWESMKKGGSRRSPCWDFEFDGKGWRWESEGQLKFFEGKLDLVLKERGEEQSGGELARYKWSKGGKVSPWGSFELKKVEGGDNGEGWSEFELMVLITGMTIIITKGSGI